MGNGDIFQSKTDNFIISMAHLWPLGVSISGNHVL